MNKLFNLSSMSDNQSLSSYPYIFLALFLSLIVSSCSSNKESNKSRIEFKINESWEFINKELSNEHSYWVESKNIEVVSLPHTWNKNNVSDSTTYKRGKFQYNKKLIINNSLKDKRIFLHFEAVNQIADIYVNSKFIQQHKGGYTAFTVEITDNVLFGENHENTLTVVVDNRFNKNIAPLSADFNFSGGIYRNVWLIATNQVHFSLSDFGSKGIYITTPKVSESDAIINVKGAIRNQTDSPKELVVVNTIKDKNGKRIISFQKKLNIKADGKANFTVSTGIENPQLWSPDNPNLYTVCTELFKNGELIDEITNPVGFRYYSFDADKGLFLNGKHIKLMGSNRHQDFADLGNAISDSIHILDIENAKKAGFNFIRLAHYPQSEVILNKADELGLIVWEEIPVVNYVTTTHEFAENSFIMLKEMIHQHFNHPAIFFWGFMNEVFLHDADGKRGQIMNYPTEYLNWTVAFAKALDSIVHQTDPYRFSAIAIHQNKLYNETRINDIPDIIGYNLYQGWYFGKAESFGKFMDYEHSKFPKRKIILSEYGAGSDICIHTTNPERFDFSIEFQQSFLKEYFHMIMARPFIGAASIWAQNDFRSDTRGDTKPKINQKGLLTVNREYKDVYFMYKANLNAEPMVYIASRDYTKRADFLTKEELGLAPPIKKQIVKLYSNIDTVELFINDKSLGKKLTDSLSTAFWEVPFNNGKNILTAKAQKGIKTFSDELEIDFQYYSTVLKDSIFPFTSLRINVGSNTEYIDNENSTWFSDKKYTQGSFGYIGGKCRRLTKSRINAPQNIPLYYTFNEGIESYKIDAPTGKYELELHFIDNENINSGQREFSIKLNNKKADDSLNILKTVGQNKVLIKNYSIEIDDNQSITIKFNKTIGLPVLSAIKLEKK